MFDLHSTLAAALDAEVVASSPLQGGDVAESFRVVLDDGRTVFAKTKRDAPAGFFSTEAAGLRWLQDAGAVPVPTVVLASDEPPLLVLEWIDEGSPGSSTEADFGRALAELHRAGAHTFGREDRRTTGSRGLPNEPCGTWA
jgi:fructosamine-3-kinase